MVNVAVYYLKICIRCYTLSISKKKKKGKKGLGVALYIDYTNVLTHVVVAAKIWPHTQSLGVALPCLQSRAVTN